MENIIICTVIYADVSLRKNTHPKGTLNTQNRTEIRLRNGIIFYD